MYITKLVENIFFKFIAVKPIINIKLCFLPFGVFILNGNTNVKRSKQYTYIISRKDK